MESRHNRKKILKRWFSSSPDRHILTDGWMDGWMEWKYSLVEERGRKWIKKNKQWTWRGECCKKMRPIGVLRCPCVYSLDWISCRMCVIHGKTDVESQADRQTDRRTAFSMTKLLQEPLKTFDWLSIAEDIPTGEPTDRPSYFKNEFIWWFFP